MGTRKELRLTPRMVGLIIAFLQFAGHGSNEVSAGALPKDPCALLNPAEVQAALDANTNIGSGVPDTTALPLAVGCTYTWGPRTKEWGQSVLTITVIDALKGWQGMSPDLIKQGILLKTTTGGPNASQIPGVGDAAVFTFEARSSNAMAEAYFQAKAVHLSVTFHRGDALQNKDKVIALLKQATARL
jgi:hypothetical protein